MPSRLTRPLPPGTVNTTLNVPLEWRLAVGKAADARGLSLGEFLKQAVERTLAYDEPATALRLRAIRTAVVAAMLLLAMPLQWIAAAKQDIGRVRTASVRVVRGKRAEWEVFA